MITYTPTHVGLPNVLVLAVHLVNLWAGWVKGGLKVIAMCWWLGGWVAHVIIASVQRIGFLFFLRLGLNFGSALGTCWDGGLGHWLDNNCT